MLRRWRETSVTTKTVHQAADIFLYSWRDKYKSCVRSIWIYHVEGEPVVFPWDELATFDSRLVVVANIFVAKGANFLVALGATVT